MKLSALAAAFALTVLPAGATPVNYDTPEAELLGVSCEAGKLSACDRLVRLTNGQCAGPAWSQCRYNSATLRLVEPGLMTPVPGFGWSRVETVDACLQDAGVRRYQDLITDSHFQVFGSCMTENT